MKLISANKLNRLWNNGVVAKMVAKTKILKTLEEIEANTSEENVAGATALKEVNNNLTLKLPDDIRLITEGSGADVKYYAQLGADAASKKLLSDNIKISTTTIYINKSTTITSSAEFVGIFIIRSDSSAQHAFWCPDMQYNNIVRLNVSDNKTCEITTNSESGGHNYHVTTIEKLN